jgi:hypothetical protein
MAKAIVKCPYCEQSFDRNDPSIEWEKVGRRYAHKKCYTSHIEGMTKEEKDLKALFDYAQSLLGEDYVYMKVKKQVEQYHKEFNFSYSGMLSSLKYFYEVLGNSKEKAAGGIGIIPYIYKQAYDYYYEIYKAQQKNKDISEYKTTVTEITIESPRMMYARPRLWFEDEEE